MNTEGTINRLRADLNEARGDVETVPFTAKQTYKAGEFIVNGAKVFVAEEAITAGETVTPGYNCYETTIAEVLNALNEK